MGEKKEKPKTQGEHTAIVHPPTKPARKGSRVTRVLK